MTNGNTMALTPECRIVWPNLFEPSSFEDSDEEVYRCMLLFENDADLSVMHTAIKAAAKKKFPGKDKEFYRQLRKPIRDGMEKAVDEHGNSNPDSFYYGRKFMNVKTRFQPQAVDIYNNPLEPDQMYGGCYVRAYLGFFGYDFRGNKGVSAGLRAVIKLKDGDPIGGGKVDTATVFADVIQERKTVIETGEYKEDTVLAGVSISPESDDIDW
jgi:hypothetical protein